MNERVNNTLAKSKFLGVMKNHVEYTLDKLSKSLYVSYRIWRFIPAEKLLQAYYSIFYPHFIYGLRELGGCYESTLKPIFFCRAD